MANTEKELTKAEPTASPVSNETTSATSINPELAASELLKNKGVLYGFGAILAVIAAYFAFNWYTGEQEKEAQEALFQAQFYFESDSLKQALKGDGPNAGFLKIADNYPFTKAANIAHLYAGTIYLKQGKFDNAIEQLSDFSSNDVLIQPRALSLLGDAYMEKKQYSEAASNYRKAAGIYPNKYFSPVYLMKLALAEELGGNKDAALSAYSELLEKYFDSSEAAEAKKGKARLEAELGK